MMIGLHIYTPVYQVLLLSVCCDFSFSPSNDEEHNVDTDRRPYFPGFLFVHQRIIIRVAFLKVTVEVEDIVDKKKFLEKPYRWSLLS